MNLNKITKALIPAALLLSASYAIAATAAPTHERIIEANSLGTQTHISQDDKKHTNVKVSHDGQDHQFSFTQQQLKDSDYIDNTLSALPDKARKDIAQLLKRMDSKEHMQIIFEGNSHANLKKLANLSPKQREKLESKLAALELMLDKKVSKLELNAEKIENKAREIEVRVLKEMETLELDELDIHVDIDDITNKIEKVAMQLENIDFDELNSAHENIIVIHGLDTDQENHNAAHRSQRIIKMIYESDLNNEQKQAIKEALN